MTEKFIDIVGFISSILSILGAIINISKSRDAKKYLEEINTKKTVIEEEYFKQKLNKVCNDLSKYIRSRKSNRGLDSETKKYEEWLNIISDLVLNLPKDFKDIEPKLKESRTILKNHVYENKSLHYIQNKAKLCLSI